GRRHDEAKSRGTGDTGPLLTEDQVIGEEMDEPAQEPSPRPLRRLTRAKLIQIIPLFDRHRLVPAPCAIRLGTRARGRRPATGPASDQTRMYTEEFHRDRTG